MKDKLQNLPNYNKKLVWKIVKIILIAIPLIILFIYLLSLPDITSVDFATLRENISNHGIKQERRGIKDSQDVIVNRNLTASETEKLKKQEEERTKYINENWADLFVESALEDYYHGDYEEAERRLGRAVIYDANNFSALKLRGQIYFEHNYYRKAYNCWEKANSIPNDDKTLARDLEVLRKLLRYSRKELDELRHKVYIEPNNKIAQALLAELEDRLKD